METDAPARRRQPIINAPLLVIFMTLLIVGLHGATYLLSDEQWVRLQYDYSLAPRRFWAAGMWGPGNDEHVYSSIPAALVTLVSTGFLHAGWFHVIVNALMLLAFGTPVARALGNNPGGWLKWMVVYLGAVIGGSALYLALTDVTNGAAVGASGGTSGLIAAAFLLDPYGRLMSPLSRSFIMMTVAFAAINALITLAGPSLLGMGIAWQAHLGGYIAGAGLMLLLARRRPSEEPA